MSRSFCILVLFLLASPSVYADIYKCPTDKGTFKYQNFPCDIDSIGSQATAPAPSASAKREGPNGFGKIDVNDPKALAELREWRLRTRPNHPTGTLFFEQFPDQMDNIYTRFQAIQKWEQASKNEPVNESVLDNPMDPR